MRLVPPRNRNLPPRSGLVVPVDALKVKGVLGSEIIFALPGLQIISGGNVTGKKIHISHYIMDLIVEMSLITYSGL